MKKIVSAIFLVLFISSGMYSQANLQPAAQIKSAMKKLEPLTGNWTGQGWIQSGQAKHTFNQSESILFKANGAVLQIDGTGKDAGTDEIVHQAYAIIWYNTEYNTYEMLAVRADGIMIRPAVNVTEGGDIIWSFPVAAGGSVKFEIDLQNDTWHEKGSYSRDGVSWMPFLEITLTKKLQNE